jgi:CubicO group peptidase (beta-lactamase class C family)
VEVAARQAMATSTAPGLAVALVHHGQLAWAKGYGLADRPTRKPVTDATRFQAASLSKPVTAWGVLRLVEQGRIGLNEPVIGHLRRWHPPPSPFDTGGITVRRLLSHTAGLSVHGYTGQTPEEPPPPIAASLSGDAGASFPVELLEAPGQRWLYSGGGYSVLQLLVEELTGRPFAAFMRTQVLGPLGMTASSFRWRRTTATARPHDRRGACSPDFTFAEQAAAGLVTTAPDLARFVAAALPGPRGEPPGHSSLATLRATGLTPFAVWGPSEHGAFRRGPPMITRTGRGPGTIPIPWSSTGMISRRLRGGISPLLSSAMPKRIGTRCPTWPSWTRRYRAPPSSI